MGLRSDGTICGNQREVYNMNRQSVLMEALPYIRKFHGKTIVIKLGGHAMVDPKIMNTVIEDAVLLHYVGMRVVLVHGGGPEITEKMKALGKEPKFIGGLRVTDAETLEIAQMVLAGKISSAFAPPFSVRIGFCFQENMQCRMIFSSDRCKQHGVTGTIRLIDICPVLYEQCREVVVFLQNRIFQ